MKIFKSNSILFLLTITVSISTHDCLTSQSSINFRLGIGQSSLNTQPKNDKFGPLITYSAGFGFESNLNESVDFKAEFLLDQRGGFIHSNDQKLILNYLNAYLGPKFNVLSENTSLFGGLFFGMLLNKSVPVKNSQYATYEFSEVDSGGWIGIIHEYLTGFGKIFFDFRYIHGLVNIDDHNSRTPLSIDSNWVRNQNFQFGLGFAFYDRP